MKVYLKQDVPGLGEANEIKTVSEGYARNYLFPRGLAAPASKGLLRKAKQQQKTQRAKEQRLRQQAEEIAERLKDHPLKFKAKAGETGRLYGSVTNADIAKAISKVIGDRFDKRQVILEHPIRELGIHLVDLKLDEGVRAVARVVVETEA